MSRPTSRTLVPLQQYRAATAANTAVLACARPGHRLLFYSPSDFDHDGEPIRDPHLRDWPAPIQEPGLPWFHVVSQGPQMIINNGHSAADQQLMQNSPDWKVRWELRGRSWLCDQLGFRPSSDPFALFELPDTVRIYTELATRTGSVGEDWENATQYYFPLIPPHLLLPLRAPSLPAIRCPYPGCGDHIDGAGDVDDHLSLEHWDDDPDRGWLVDTPLMSNCVNGYVCPCGYDHNGARLRNAPLEMNRRGFFAHVLLHHFYDEAVYCRFCAIPIVDAEKYPRHMLECQVLRPLGMAMTAEMKRCALSV